MSSVMNTLTYIHTFTYQKALLHALLLLVFKIVENLQCILTYINLYLFYAEMTNNFVPI